METTFQNATQRSLPPFRNDIVGSFLRPTAIKEARAKFAAGEITPEELRKIEDQEIIKLVQKQKEIGLKSVTDGELRRSWWNLDFLWGFDGVEKKKVEKGFVFHETVTRPETSILTGKIGFTSHPHVEHFKFLKSIAGDDVVPKQNIPSAAQFLHNLQLPGSKPITDSIYPDVNDLINDIASAYNKAILAFYNAGCRYIQIDDPGWGVLCDPKVRENIEKQGRDFNQVLRTNIELNNKCLENLPSDLIISTHVCRGNFRSDWMAEGSYDPVAELLLGSSNVNAFYMEFDTERAGGFEPLKYLKGDKQVVLGLFSSKFAKLEDKKEILAKIEEAAKIVNINQICISPQCGFASTEEGNTLTEEEQWNKLRFIKEIADSIWH